MHKIIIFITITFLWLALACSRLSDLAVQSEQNPLLEGECDVYGTNPDGRAYFGNAQIVVAGRGHRTRIRNNGPDDGPALSNILFSVHCLTLNLVSRRRRGL
jgi:hypothetical protein